MSVDSGPRRTMETVQDEYALSLKDVLRIIQRRVWAILLIALLLAGVVLGFDFLRTPTYEASVKIWIGQEQSSVPEGLQSQVQGLQQLTKTMAEAIDTRPVAEGVIQQL